MRKKIVINSAAALVAQLVAIVVGFILPRLILGQYGSEVNGLTQSIKQFLGVISFLDLGVGQVVRSALYTPLARNDRKQLIDVMASGRKFYNRIAYILVGYTGLLVCVFPLLTDQKFDWIFTATLIAAMALSSFVQFYFGIANEQLLHADQKNYISYSLQVIGNVLNLFVSIILLRLGCSIQMVKLVASIIFMVRPIVIAVYVQKKYSLPTKATYTQEPLKQKWNGVAQHAAAVVLDGTDIIVLTMLSTLSNVSVYSVYSLVITSIQSFYQAATAGLHSAAGLLWAKQDYEAMNRMYSWVEMLLHFATVFVFGCMGVLIVPFVQVYTYGVTDAEYIQPVFAALITMAYAIRCLRTPYNIWILAAGHFKQTQICHIVAAGLNLAISIVAVIRLGLVGVAIGTLVAMVYQTLWMAIYNTKHLLKRPLWETVKRFLVDALVLTLIWTLGLTIQMPEVSYFGWFVTAVKVALIALGVTLLATFVFYRSELKKWIGEYIRK